MKYYATVHSGDGAVVGNASVDAASEYEAGMVIVGAIPEGCWISGPWDGHRIPREARDHFTADA